jgi:hypothetical protein
VHISSWCCAQAYLEEIEIMNEINGVLDVGSEERLAASMNMNAAELNENLELELAILMQDVMEPSPAPMAKYCEAFSDAVRDGTEGIDSALAQSSIAAVSVVPTGTDNQKLTKGKSFMSNTASSRSRVNYGKDMVTPKKSTVRQQKQVANVLTPAL